MIKSIEIHNFKIFKNAKINLKLDEKRSINTLKKTNKQKDGYYPFVSAVIGKNASGKSTLLESIYFFNQVCYNLIYESVYQMLLHELKHSSRQSKNSNHIKKIDRNKVIAHFQKEFFRDLNKNIIFILKFVDKNQVIKLKLKITKDLLISEKLYVNDILSKLEQSDVFINQFKSKIFDLKFQKFNFKYLDHHFDLFPYFKLLNLSNKYKIWNKKNLLSWIRIADDKIVDITINKNGEIKNLFIKLGDNDKKITLYELSTGTIAWISIATKIFVALHYKSTFVFADEIDRSLHPTLVKFIIKIFQNKNINKAKSQLLFTTHSPTILDELRKDEINFINYKNEIKNLGNDEQVPEDIVFSRNFNAEKLSSHPGSDHILEFLETFDA